VGSKGRETPLEKRPQPKRSPTGGPRVWFAEKKGAKFGTKDGFRKTELVQTKIPEFQIPRGTKEKRN